MITALSKEQEEGIIKVRDEYLDLFYSLKLDEDKAKKLVAFVYKQAGCKKPKVFFVDSPLGAQVMANTLKNKNIRENINKNIWENIRENIWENIRENIYKNIREKIWENIYKNIWENIYKNIRENIWENIYKNINKNIRENIKRGGLSFEEFSYCLDSWDYGWVAYYDYFTKNKLIKGNFEVFNKYKKLVKSNIFACITLDGAAIVSRPPTKLLLDEDKNLHSIKERAIVFGDGYGEYYVHGEHIKASNKKEFEKAIQQKIVERLT